MFDLLPNMEFGTFFALLALLLLLSPIIITIWFICTVTKRLKEISVETQKIYAVLVNLYSQNLPKANPNGHASVPTQPTVPPLK